MNSMEAVGAPASCVILIAMVSIFSHSLVRGPVLSVRHGKGGRVRAPPLREAQRGVPSADNSAVESFWIRVAGEDGEGAVDLLGQQHAGEFVRHGERGEGDFLFGAGTQFGGEAFGVAAQEEQ